jgi:hypothetical protein
MGATATLVREAVEGWHGDVKVYELSELVSFPTHGGHDVETDHLVVSGVRTDGLTETAVWASDPAGGLIDLFFLRDGIVPGEVDHTKALQQLGLELSEEVSDERAASDSE